MPVREEGLTERHNPPHLCRSRTSGRFTQPWQILQEAHHSCSRGSCLRYETHRLLHQIVPLMNAEGAPFSSFRQSWRNQISLFRDFGFTSHRDKSYRSDFFPGDVSLIILF